MKLRLIFLLTLLAVMAWAQPPFLRTPYSTGTVAVVDARVTGIASNLTAVKQHGSLVLSNFLRLGISNIVMVSGSTAGIGTNAGVLWITNSAADTSSLVPTNIFQFYTNAAGADYVAKISSLSNSMHRAYLYASDYPSIQAALNAAQRASAFDTNLAVLISPGHYYENLKLTNSRGFKIEGVGPGSVTIEGAPAFATDGAWFGEVSGIAFKASAAVRSVVDLDGNKLQNSPTWPAAGGTFGVQQVRFHDFTIDGAGLATNGLSIVPIGSSFGQGSENRFEGFQILSCINAAVLVYGANAINNAFVSGDIQSCGVAFSVFGGPVHVDGVSLENNLTNIVTSGSTGPASTFRNIRSEGKAVQAAWPGPAHIDNWFDAYVPTAWQATNAYVVGDAVIPTVDGGIQWRCTTAGTSSNTEPAWTTNAGYYGSDTAFTLADGTVTWTRYDAASVTISSGSIIGSSFPYTRINAGIGVPFRNRFSRADWEWSPGNNNQWVMQNKVTLTETGTDTNIHNHFTGRLTIYGFGYSSDGTNFIRIPTNAPTDGQVIVATGTGGATKFSSTGPSNPLTNDESRTVTLGPGQSDVELKLKKSDASRYGSLGFYTATSRTFFLGSYADTTLRLTHSGANEDDFIMDSSGRVGLLATPTNRFDVSGHTSLRSNVFAPNLRTNTSPQSFVAWKDGEFVQTEIPPAITSLTNTASGTGPHLAFTNAPTFYDATMLGTSTYENFVTEKLTVLSNVTQFAASAHHQIDRELSELFDGTNSMAQHTALSYTNFHDLTNHHFHIVLEGAASGGSDYNVTNLVGGALGSIPTLFKSNGVNAVNVFFTVTNGTTLELDALVHRKRGTNFIDLISRWGTR